MFRENKWTFTALAVIGLTLLFTRGGIASLMPLMRAMLPVIIAVIAYRFVRGKVRDVMGQQGRPDQFSGRSDERQIIDLCPKCGAYLRPGHRCQKS